MAEKIFLADKPTLDEVNTKTNDIHTKIRDLGIVLDVNDDRYRAIVRKTGKLDEVHLASKLDYAASNDMVGDENYLYICGEYNYVYKLNKSDLGRVVQSPYFIKNKCITLDDNYIYTGTSNGNGSKIYKLNKSDLSIVLNSVNLPSAPSAICADDNYLYVCVGSKVYIFNKMDLSLVTSTINTGDLAFSIVVDNNFFYVGCYGTSSAGGYIKKYDKTTYALLFTSESHLYSVSGLAMDNKFLYAGTTNGKLVKLDKNDLTTKLSASDTTNSPINDLVMDGNYLYTSQGGSIGKYTKESLRLFSTSLRYTGTFNCLSIDDQYVYGAGSTSDVFGYGNFDNIAGYKKEEAII